MSCTVPASFHDQTSSLYNYFTAPNSPRGTPTCLSSSMRLLGQFESHSCTQRSLVHDCPLWRNASLITDRPNANKVLRMQNAERCYYLICIDSRWQMAASRFSHKQLLNTAGYSWHCFRNRRGVVQINISQLQVHTHTHTHSCSIMKNW